MNACTAMLWPLESLGEALEALCLLSELGGRMGASSFATPATAQSLEAHADALGLEAEPIEVAYRDVTQTLANATPAILEARAGVLVLVGAGARGVRLLLPNQTAQWVSKRSVREFLVAAVEGEAGKSIDVLLDDSSISSRKRKRVRTRLLDERIARTIVACGWLIRPSPSLSYGRRLLHERLWAPACQVLALHTASTISTVAAWWLLSNKVLGSTLESGWVSTLGLLLLTALATKWGAIRISAELALRSGVILKQKLLANALSVGSRRFGPAELLSRVAESEALETLGIGAVLVAAFSAVDLCIALRILSWQSLGATLGLLLAWCGVFTALSMRFVGRFRLWSELRLALSARTIDGMIGHRTRLVQGHFAKEAEGDDRLLVQYAEASVRVDAAETDLHALGSRGWLLAGFVALLPALANGASTLVTTASIGAVVLAAGAFATLARAGVSFAGALVALRAVESLLVDPKTPPRPPHETAMSGEAPLIALRGVDFCHPARAGAGLKQTDLEIWRGERLLIEGPSGAGKSTLASLLSGFVRPNRGVMLLGGLDLEVLGESAWRSRVVLVPQFHDNFILSGPLAFNLLMGRQWPPTRSDLDLAEQICVELDLGSLLAAMPSGLMQLVGETGWRLSQGERARVFIARALLQHANLVVLDESFSSFDPFTVQLVMKAVLARAKTLLVIAHPPSTANVVHS